MRQKIENGVEGWDRVIEGRSGYVQPAKFKLIDFLRQEQCATENKLSILRAGKEFPKMTVIKTKP